MAIRSLPNGAPTPIPFSTTPTRRDAYVHPASIEARDRKDARRAVRLTHDLVKALRDALDAVDYARQHGHPALCETLDTLTERARATLSAVRT